MTVVFSYEKYINLLNYKLIDVHAAHSSGFTVWESPLKVGKTRINLFQCKDGTFMSVIFVCDGRNDCVGDNSDEALCTCSGKQGQESSSALCKTTSTKQECGPLFFIGSNGKCKTYQSVADEEEWYFLDSGEKYGVSQTLLCKNNESGFLNDLFGDCFQSSEDEPTLKLQMTNNSFFQCRKPYELQCRPGHPKCFNITDICIYSLHKNIMFPCRNGGHLHNCQEFECNTKFKCHMSHCIAWSYVCDNKWDCPDGEDESVRCRHTYHCENLFKCKGTHQTCIHVEEVCNGIGDCPQNEDEVACELHNMLCLAGCSCLFMAMQCHTAHSVEYSVTFPFLFVSITKTTFVVHLLHLFESALFFILTSNQITKLSHRELPVKLMLLNLSFNHLILLESSFLESKLFLKKLLIISNNISTVNQKAFHDLPQLSVIDLSNNPLTLLSKTNFEGTKQIKIFSINHVNSSAISHGLLPKWPIQVIETTSFYICCHKADNQHCEADKAWHNSCTLLPHVGMVVLFGLEGNMILCLSIISIFLHMVVKHASKAFTMIVAVINTTDLLCVLFVLTIFIADILFKKVYVLSDVSWRQSNFCLLASSSLLLFAILSQALLILLSVSRLMVVIKPMTTSFKSKSFVSKCIAVLVLTSLTIALLFEVSFVLSLGVQPFDLCLPFIDPAGSILSAILTWFLILTHCSTSVSIIALHIALVHSLIQSQKNIQKSKTDD